MNARVSSLSGLALLAIAGACSRSSSSSPPVLVTAILGPEGGVLTVDQGVQDGLILTVPPGAVSEPTTFRVVDDARGLPPTVRGVSVAPQPGFALRIEPRDLVLAEKATLRLPYRPFQVTSTAPGNVRVQHDNPVASLQYYPEAVDVGEAWVEVRTATLDRFQVVVGPSADRPQDYLPDDEDLALLGDGWTFVVEPVEATSPFAQQDARRWRLRGPSFDESLILVGDRVVAREADLATTAAWRQLWDPSYPLYGSTASMSIFLPARAKYMPNASMNVRFPTPGAPVIPTRIEPPAWGSRRVSNSSASA